ncbi:hypothetical protein KZP23_01005 [Echinicola marina]|uniref:hypothetical protein n=1 Tax=Echinicola marina TaxID=2859768 RepID=UPI001CF61E01|nr:hypothetical protein [Echinicola marina]UCS93650.1 hypothetical protein KZP23_01005 [Echinicola marina]
MKKIAIVFVLSSFILTGANAYPIPNQSPILNLLQSNKNEIEAQDLPKAVKETILSKEKTKSLPIYKAYEITDASGKTIYEISFGLEKVEFEKKYNEKGDELED